MNNELNLYKHNKESYQKIKDSFNSGENIVGIVHATGTGKTFNALAFINDNKDKLFLYVVPTLAIVEHVKKVIESLNIENKFTNIRFITYQALSNLNKYDKEELGKNRLCNLDMDYLILDEFHHVGAPVWGDAIDKIVSTHKNLRIFGMSAYTIRDRGTIYERDMAKSSGNELFSDKIVSRYDLVDAMLDQVLPKPIYRSGYVHLSNMAATIEEKLIYSKISSEEKTKYLETLSMAKKRIHESDDISNILKYNLKQDGKYIYFCPMKSTDEMNDLSTIMKDLKEDLMKFMNEEDIIFYKTTSKDKKDGESNREAFYNDTDLLGNSTDGKLQIMFAINQYNEGVHTPNIDGIILGRTTTSDIVYFEQIGRALSISSKTSPIIIDLVNNVKFIKELETNLKDRNRLRIEQHISNPRTNSKELLKLEFDISMENVELYNILEELGKKSKFDWEDYYELLKKYYQVNQHSKVPWIFKTYNGVDEDCNGINLGEWTSSQRVNYDKLPIDKQSKLEMVELTHFTSEERWYINYKLVEVYYKNNGHTKIPLDFKTTDGVSEDENGRKIGIWIKNQRLNYDKLNDEQKEKLKKIKIDLHNREEKWNLNYCLVKKYYEKNGHLKPPKDFKTLDGVTEDKNGNNLYNWLKFQRIKYESLSAEQQEKLSNLNYSINVCDDQWEYKYNILKKYYEVNGNLTISMKFRTLDGTSEDEKGILIGSWLQNQKKCYEKLSDERKEKLNDIGLSLDVYNDAWNNCFNLVENYYKENGHTKVPKNFKTLDGITEYKDGINIYSWLRRQRNKYKSLSSERKEKLMEVNFSTSVCEDQWEYKYNMVKKYYEKNGHIKLVCEYKTIDGITEDEDGQNLYTWLHTQRRNFVKLTKERKEKLRAIGFIDKINKNTKELDMLCTSFNIDFKKHWKTLELSSVQFIESKILFLLDNKIPIESNGTLHEIFTMTNQNMILKYGVSMEELYNKYITNKQK